MKSKLELFAVLLTFTLTCGDPSPNLVTAFQGVWGSNFNETLFFCPDPEIFEWEITDNASTQWGSIPVLVLGDENSNSDFNVHGTALTGNVYQNANGSFIYYGVGASSNGAYLTYFSLNYHNKPNYAYGYYTFFPQSSISPYGNAGIETSLAEFPTGPWVLYKKGTATDAQCATVWRRNKNLSNLHFNNVANGYGLDGLGCNPYACNNPGADGTSVNNPSCPHAFTTPNSAAFTPQDAATSGFANPASFTCNPNCGYLPC